MACPSNPYLPSILSKPYPLVYQTYSVSFQGVYRPHIRLKPWQHYLSRFTRFLVARAPRASRLNRSVSSLDPDNLLTLNPFTSRRWISLTLISIVSSSQLSSVLFSPTCATALVDSTQCPVDLPSSPLHGSPLACLLDKQD